MKRVLPLIVVIVIFLTGVLLKKDRTLPTFITCIADGKDGFDRYQVVREKTDRQSD